MNVEKLANNLVYGSLLAIGYFLAAPNLKHSLDHGLAQGAAGFAVLVICHGYAQYVTQDAATTRSRLHEFIVAEVALVFPFAIASMVAFFAALLVGSQSTGVVVGLCAALVIVCTVTYGTARRAEHSLLESTVFAAIATAVGAALSVVRILA